MSLLRPAVLFIALLTLAACTQTAGPDIRNEIGANGLPTPRAISARFVDAIGGEDLIRSYSSMTSRGSFSLAAFGVNGDIVIRQAAPNLIYQQIELGGLGTINSGYNGEVGWSVDPLQGPTILQGDALSDMIDQADFYVPLNIQSAEGAETIEQTTFATEPVYRVRINNTRGADVFMFFHVDTSLMLGMELEAETPIGPAMISTYMSGYEDFGGYRIPTRLIIDQAGQEVVIEIDSVSFDDVSADAFTPPPAIRSQL